MSDLDRIGELFTSRYALVLEISQRYAPHPDLAYDIAQQSFVVFVKGVVEKSWDINSDVGPLLRQIVKNIAMTTWQNERKHSSEALKMIAERFFRQPSEEYLQDEVAATNPDNLEARRLAALKICMQKLTSRSINLLNRHYIDGTTLEELGCENEMNGNAMRQLFSRLRLKLRDCIERTVKKK